MKVFIIIPAYNEEKRIAQVLQELSVLPYEVVVIDDCSADKTTDIVRGFKVTLLRHKLNRGQGAALQTGNQYAVEQGADILVHFDGDGQFLVSEIADFVKQIENGYDVVLGSRFLGKKSEVPKIKNNIIFPIARVVNLFFGIRLTDPQSGFRAFSRKAAQFLQIENDGGAHCSEIASKAFKNKLKIKEIPIFVQYHRFGQSFLSSRGRKQSALQIVFDLLFSKITK
jgi:glycosyltransferase involved in cell wall biosynthesis